METTLKCLLGRFQLSNSCWICDKFFDVGDDKVRDHCHITGKYRGAAHWSGNVNFKLSEKIPVIFHNLRGYDSHLIIEEVSKFNVKVNVIPNVWLSQLIEICFLLTGCNL